MTVSDQALWAVLYVVHIPELTRDRFTVTSETDKVPYDLESHVS
jgi:hypothetical protein